MTSFNRLFRNMTDVETNETVLAKQLTISDATRGKCNTTVLSKRIV